MKRILVLLLIGCLVLTAFVGCGSDNAKTEDETEETEVKGKVKEEKKPEKKDVTLTYMASQDWIRDAELELAKRFEEETGIKVDYQIVPSDQYDNLLATKLNSGECTDIFGGQSGKFDLVPKYNVEKNCVDLTDEEWVKRFDPLFKEHVTYNGKVYGLSIWDTSYTFQITYNKKIFNDLNLSIPKTYEEFKSVCQKIKDAGITPIYECVSDGWHHVLPFCDLGPKLEELNSGLYEKLNNNGVKFTDVDDMERLLSQMLEFVQLGFYGDNFMSNTYADTKSAMASGKYAMTIYPTTLPQELASEFPELKEEDFGLITIPFIDNDIIDVVPACPSKFIYSGSKHIEEAKEFFRFLTKNENLQYMIDNEPRFVSLCFEGLESNFSPTQEEFFNTYTKRGAVLQNSVKYVNPQWMEIGKDIEAMYIGAITPRQVLENIDKRRADMAKAQKDPAWEE